MSLIVRRGIFAMANIFIACPQHDRQVDFRTAKAIWRTASQRHSCDICPQKSSLLATNCNILWCTALNYRATKPLQWFAMLHSDVVPEDWWVDILIAEAERHGAD